MSYLYRENLKCLWIPNNWKVCFAYCGLKRCIPAKCTIYDTFSAILFSSEHDFTMSLYLALVFVYYDKMSPKEVEKLLKKIVQNEAKQMSKVHVSAYKTTVC